MRTRSKCKSNEITNEKKNVKNKAVNLHTIEQHVYPTFCHDKIISHFYYCFPI